MDSEAARTRARRADAESTQPPTSSAGPGRTRTRARYALATLGALSIAAVFATVGDGVEVPEATGLRRIVVDSGHLAVWILLGGAFGIAAVRGEWNRASGVLAAGAGATYAVFLGAVFLGRA